MASQPPPPPFKAKDCPCYKNREIVCLHCATYVPVKKRLQMTDFHKANWIEEYGDYPSLNFSYKPKILCGACAKYLERRRNNETKRKYLKPAIFKKPSERHENCFVKQVAELVGEARFPLLFHPEKIQYPSVSNLVRPVENLVRSEDPEEEEQEVEAFELNEDEDDIQSFSELCLEEEDDDYVPEDEQRPSKKQKVSERTPIKQSDVTNLIKVLKLPADHAEVLASFFKRFTLTELKFRVTTYRTRTQVIKPYFKTINNCVILDNVEGYVVIF